MMGYFVASATTSYSLSMKEHSIRAFANYLFSLSSKKRWDFELRDELPKIGPEWELCLEKSFIQDGQKCEMEIYKHKTQPIYWTIVWFQAKLAHPKV